MLKNKNGLSARLCGAATVGLLLLTAPASAEPTQAQIGAIRASCQSDYRANCAGVPAGGSAALACLQKNLASLSPACQTAVNAASGTAAPAAAETPPAAPSAPSEKTPPAAATATPPAQSFPRLSMREELMVINAACRDDYRSLCGSVPPGQGRIADCLRTNAASLSEPCKNALMGARP